MTHSKNEWWIQGSDLHIGDTINLEEDGITMTSFRHSYEKINDLKLFTHEDYPEYCLIYSSSFPMLDIWKYNIRHDAVPGTSYTKFIKLPLMDVYHGERIVSCPYSPETIVYQKDCFIINWSNTNQSTFEISSKSFINETLPIRKTSDYNIEDLITLYSPCNKFYIKYAKEFEFVDVFNEQDEFLFRLKHNTYKSYYCCNIIEFVNDRILINDEHGSFGIYDMSGNLCHNICGGDEFYTNKFRIKEDDGKEYLVVYGFIWSPVNFMSIYDLNKMMIDKSYAPDQYWEKDTHDLQYPTEFIDNKVCYGMTPTDFKEFMIDKKEKKIIAKQELLNTRWNEENILKIILNEYHIDETIKNKILAYKEFPIITCFGGNSGCEFKEHADNLILKKVNENSNKRILDLIARLVFRDDYEKWSLNGSQLKEVNLIFTIDNILKMHIIIPMIKLENKDAYWFPENDENVIINFSC